MVSYGPFTLERFDRYAPQFSEVTRLKGLDDSVIASGVHEIMVNVLNKDTSKKLSRDLFAPMSPAIGRILC